jgi:hypothetical protein
LKAVQEFTKATRNLATFLTQDATGDYTYSVRATSSCLQIKVEWKKYMSLMVFLDDTLTKLINLSGKIDKSISIMGTREQKLV